MAIMSRKRVANYRQVQMTTSSPGQRVVMLYDGIVRNLRVAIEAFADNSPQRFDLIHQNLQQAERIVFELQQALDMENGGEIANSLNDLYEFWIIKISEANVHKELGVLREVLQMASELREAWNQAASEALKLGL